MSALAIDLDNGIAKLPFHARFESSVPENTIVTLNKLCAACTAFIANSTLLQRLGRKDIKIGVEELGRVGPPRDLKNGYTSGECHFCALLWLRAGGYHLDPERAIRPMELDVPVEVRLTGRDPDKEYEIEVAKETDRTRKLWYKIASMPPISENGFLDLRILLPKEDNVSADLRIHHSSNPKLNKETLNFISSPISSRHASTYSQIQTW